MEQEERCVRIFLESLKSDVTKKNYLRGMKYFKDFSGIEKYSDILKMEQQKLTELIEDYIIHRKKTNSPNALNYYYFPIQAFLEMNDVLLNFKKFRRLFPAKVKKAPERGWTAEEIKTMLSVCSNHRQRAVIHFENASGGRVGIFNDLCIKHLTEINDEIYGKCYAVTGYAEAEEEYTTFLTPEATAALDEYVEKRRVDGENITKESPVFRTEYSMGTAKVTPATSRQLESMVAYIQKRAGLRDPASKKKNGRFAVPTNHGFRYRFDEVIKNVANINVHVAEKMFAHTSRIVFLDTTYNNPNIERMFEEYKKIIPHIMIDDSGRHKLELAKKEQINQELKKKVDEIKDLKQKMDGFEKLKQELREEFLDEIKNLKMIPKKD
ncbi:MAG: hypothetical protein ACR2LL_00335 [Nitrosopumilus sp.]